MSKKSNKALQRLESALLEAAPEEADPLDEHEKTLRRSKPCRIYNTDRADGDLEHYSRQVLKPKRRFSVLALLLILGLLAVTAWVLWQQGVIPW